MLKIKNIFQKFRCLAPFKAVFLGEIANKNRYLMTFFSEKMHFSYFFVMKRNMVALIKVTFNALFRKIIVSWQQSNEKSVNFWILVTVVTKKNVSHSIKIIKNVKGFEITFKIHFM